MDSGGRIHVGYEVFLSLLKSRRKNSLRNRENALGPESGQSWNEVLGASNKKSKVGNGLRSCSLNVLRCSGIAVISVFCERAPKIHREAFATIETSLGEPCRVPKGRLKLVPRPRWSLGACRPVFGVPFTCQWSGPQEPCQKRRPWEIGGAPA
ncbi:hypothetical protein CRG98_021113 [Punica granatum]|uniref:Uncharacterized protein n=1 Tax=Punica granatum TaxID=22663 RepID=A0A2I0JRG9_PUNGR|nr:hypothetical protein CRG98_021113 [Punica granatum]